MDEWQTSEVEMVQIHKLLASNWHSCSPNFRTKAISIIIQLTPTDVPSKQLKSPTAGKENHLQNGFWRGYLWATLAPSLKSYEVSPILAAAKLFPELLVPSFVKNSCTARVPPRLPCSQRRPGAFIAPWGKVGVACDSRFAHDLWIDRWNQNQCRCPM